jgi:hypothetical protein
MIENRAWSRSDIKRLFHDLMIDNAGDLVRKISKADGIAFVVADEPTTALGGEEFYFVTVIRIDLPESHPDYAQVFRWYTGEIVKYKWMPFKGPAKGHIKWQ